LTVSPRDSSLLSLSLSRKTLKLLVLQAPLLYIS
jgi:hypothetical protein